MEYGISITTLEEVFLKVGEKLEHEQDSNTVGDPQSKNTEMLLLNQENISNIKIKTAEENEYLDNLVREPNHCKRFLQHFQATMLKRLRVIRRDIKSFIFELILPILIILFALLLMKISFITDLPAQTIDLSLYLSEQNPVVVPVSSSDTNFTTAQVTAALATAYGASISTPSFTNSSTATTFDYNTLYPIKQNQKTLKGGLFFVGQSTISNKTAYEYYSIVNTRSPTSLFFLPTLGAQIYINKAFSKSITIDITNSPLPRTFAQLQINNTISGFLGAFVFSLALAFKFASIAGFIVKER